MINVEVEDIKLALGLEGEEYDQIIEMIIPLQLIHISKTLDFDLTSIETGSEAESLVKLLLIAATGCYLIKVIPDFGTKTFNYRVGNVSETFMRRYYRDFDDWCDYYDFLLSELASILGTGRVKTFKRLGVSDAHPKPY